MLHVFQVINSTRTCILQFPPTICSYVRALSSQAPSTCGMLASPISWHQQGTYVKSFTQTTLFITFVTQRKVSVVPCAENVSFCKMFSDNFLSVESLFSNGARCFCFLVVICDGLCGVHSFVKAHLKLSVQFLQKLVFFLSLVKNDMLNFNCVWPLLAHCILLPKFLSQFWKLCQRNEPRGRFVGGSICFLLELEQIYASR